jgi:hypothetical protein
MARSDGLPSDAPSVQTPLTLVTFWLPLHGQLGLPNAEVVLVAEKEHPELEGVLVVVNGQAVVDSEGHSGIRLEIIRLEDHSEPTRDLARAALHAAQRTGYPASNSPPADDSQGETVLVVEATAMVRATPNSPAFLRDAFDRCLNAVRRLQLGYVLTVGDSEVELISAENLPLLLPVTVRGVLESGELAERQDAIYLHHPDLLSRRGPSPIVSVEQFQQVVQATGFTQFVQGLDFADFRNDAKVQLFVHGNYRMAIVAAAASAEEMLTLVIQLLWWEEDMSTQNARELLDARDSFARLVSRECPSRLKGRWSFDQRGPIRNWRDCIARPRNRIVHQAYAPSRREAVGALDALDELTSFIADRFADSSVLKTYPWSAILSVGPASLGRRNAWTESLKAMLDTDYLRRQVEFLTWRSDVYALLPEG